MRLFWVCTEDHHEDWFIFAETEVEAEKLHEELEGYNPGDASAILVCYVPDDINVIEGWPETEDLINLGAVFLRCETPRKVEVGNCVYTEGGLDSLIEISLNIKH